MGDRRIVSGIIFVIMNRLRRRDAPAEYGPHKTIYNRFIRWSWLGVFNKIFAALTATTWKRPVHLPAFPADGRSRQLFFFVNDAALPLDWLACKPSAPPCHPCLAWFPIKGRYQNNTDAGKITITPKAATPD